MAGTIIIGAGPGIGAAVARRFAREGMPIALLARTPSSIDAARGRLDGAVPVHAATVDASDDEALRAALDEAVAKLGVPDVLVYNAGAIRRDEPGELGMDELLGTWAINVGGALVAASHLAPGMVEGGGGTVLITGGMPEPVPAFTSLSLGKAGVRALADLLHRTYGADGVHVATVTVAGEVAPGTAFDPDLIAEHYWELHSQAPGEWELERVHG